VHYQQALLKEVYWNNENVEKFLQLFCNFFEETQNKSCFCVFCPLFLHVESPENTSTL